MTNLSRLFREKCRALAGNGGDVSAANEWFLRFSEEIYPCWAFCCEILSQAPTRYEEANLSGIEPLDIVHECFFAVKLLHNTVLTPNKWNQITMDQKTSVQQVYFALCCKNLS